MQVAPFDVGSMRVGGVDAPSVHASAARACTLEFLFNLYANQHAPFTATVNIMTPIVVGVRRTREWSCPIRRWTPSRATWVNEVIIMMEKTRMEMGSRRERPTGSGFRRTVSFLL